MQKQCDASKRTQLPLPSRRAQRGGGSTSCQRWIHQQEAGCIAAWCIHVHCGAGWHCAQLMKHAVLGCSHDDRPAALSCRLLQDVSSKHRLLKIGCLAAIKPVRYQHFSHSMYRELGRSSWAARICRRGEHLTPAPCCPRGLQNLLSDSAQQCRVDPHTGSAWGTVQQMLRWTHL